MQTPKPKPISFMDSLIKAIILGNKTQTRRIINPQPVDLGNGWFEWGYAMGAPKASAPKSCTWHAETCQREAGTAPIDRYCPYGPVGRAMWAKEAWTPYGDGGGRWFRAGAPDWYAGKLRGWLDYPYRLGGVIAPPEQVKWKSAMLMPRWASRLDLEVVEVRAQRLQDISEEDAKAEGVVKNWIGPDPCPPEYQDEWMNYGSGEDDFPCFSAKDSYKSLWDSINAERGYSWDANQWVWAITFKVISD